MSEEERLLKFENELNFGIETRDGAFYVPKDVAVKAASELLDELAQPQLTIPKSIAKLIDTGDTKYIRWAYADELIVCSDLAEDEWKAHEKREDEIVRRKALIQAYLAGKALGVDLVKVGG